MSTAEVSHDLSALFLELGAAIVGLSVLTRLASGWGFSAIPLYLVAGLAFGNGGLLPMGLSEEFIRIGGEIGVLLLLFMLGLEYTGDQLRSNLRQGFPAAAADFLLNFLPGVGAGLLLGWDILPAVLLGGVTWMSSSGIIAKVLGELNRLESAETPVILSVLVLEDLAMAVYLPVVAVLLRGGDRASLTISVALALATVVTILYIALRQGRLISRLLSHPADDVVLLSTFGAVLLVAGIAQRLHVSAAIGAFLVGVTLSGPIAHQTQRLLAPLRDLFAAIFFFFFGLNIDPASLYGVAVPAITLAAITAFTKVVSGYWAASHAGKDKEASLRAGILLISRGEFSIVIAGLGTVVEPRLGPLAGAYVLSLAFAGPLAARLVK